MSVKNPRNGLTFDQVANELLENNSGQWAWVGNNTYVEWIKDDVEEPFIAMTFHLTKVVNFLDNDTVQLFDGGFMTTATGRRLDWALLPLGFRLTTSNAGEGRVRWGHNHAKFKVYSIKTGAYRDYTPGMIVERGAF
jgi:hypothetical protein